jgi:hypothetical protein
LTLERVSIGPSQDIRLDTVVVHAGPLTLLGSDKVFDSVEVNGVTLGQEALSGTAAWITPTSGTPAFMVRKIQMNRVRATLNEIELPVLNAELVLARDGALQNAMISDGKARIGFSPKDRGWQMNLSASGWAPPLGPRLQFDELTLAAVIDRQQAAVTKIEGRVGRASIKGVAKVNWGGSVRVAGELNISDGDLGQLLPGFTRDFSASGTLSANLTYVLQGSTLSALFANPRIEASFNVERGVLNNVDVVRAIQSPSRDGIRGGKTSFDVLAGSVEITGKRYSYRQVRLSSGPMNATGNFDLAPDGDLSGRISAELGTKSIVIARGMLNVAGNLKAPLLRP